MVNYNKTNKVRCSTMWFLFLTSFIWIPVIGPRKYSVFLAINLIIGIIYEFLVNGNVDFWNYLVYVLVSILAIILSFLLF